MGNRRGIRNSFQKTIGQPVPGLLRLIIGLLIMISADQSDGRQLLLDSKHSDPVRTGTKLGVVTLSDNFPLKGFYYPSKPQWSTRDFSNAALQHHVFATMIEKNHAKQRARKLSHASFSSAPLSGLPEIAQFEQAALGEEITPVAEPGTIVAAILATGFLMFKSLRRLNRDQALTWRVRTRSILGPV